jgi:hypothetical protein
MMVGEDEHISFQIPTSESVGEGELNLDTRNRGLNHVILGVEPIFFSLMLAD